jgi:hypothetical protein
MQKRITVASLKSLHSNGYEVYLDRMGEQSHSRFAQVAPLQNGVNVNIADIYTNLDKT